MRISSFISAIFLLGAATTNLVFTSNNNRDILYTPKIFLDDTATIKSIEKYDNSTAQFLIDIYKTLKSKLLYYLLTQKDLIVIFRQGIGSDYTITYTFPTAQIWKISQYSQIGYKKFYRYGYKMNIKPDCLVCLYNQALKTTKLLGLDDEKSAKILFEVAKILPNYSLNYTPPAIAKDTYSLIEKLTNNNDPLKKAKKLAIKEAKKFFLNTIQTHFKHFKNTYNSLFTSKGIMSSSHQNRVTGMTLSLSLSIYIYIYIWLKV